LNKIKFIKYFLFFFTFYVNSISAQTIFDTNKYDSIYFKSENFIIVKEKDSIKLLNTDGDIYKINNYLTIAEMQANVA
jgi:hypothetical protein